MLIIAQLLRASRLRLRRKYQIGMQSVWRLTSCICWVEFALHTRQGRVLRLECLRTRRTAQQTRGSTHYVDLMEAFRRKRLEFKHSIEASKGRAYKELLDTVDLGSRL